jgi:putative cardiolipin synthase
MPESNALVLVVTCIKRLINFSAMALLVFSAGCVSVPTDYPRTHSTALADYQSTTLGKRWAKLEAQHPGESGFAILPYGRNAFTLRIAAAELAEKTLDLQVYIWESDETGRILAERLIRAADRGVRLRLLVDDMGIAATDDKIASMDAHPNIEIRIFNPFAHRNNSMLDFITDMDRVNHRMHNKTMVMDNSFAVVGGRNIGDHYFGVNSDTNFRDLDIMAVGPVVRDISRVFDHFWQGEWAVPIEALVERPNTEVDLLDARVRLRDNIAAGHYPYSIDDDTDELLAEITDANDVAVWAPGAVVWDDPTEMYHEEGTGNLITALRKKFDTVQDSYTIESAYFVVLDRGVATVKRMVDRGVEVRILTNSLASNDVLAAHAGHANYREELLEVGAEIYELRPDGGVIKKNWKGESKAGLHTKAMVFDKESLFIGSFNLDPRSANINTEAGIYVESRELSAILLAYMEEGVLPENSYRLELDDDGDLVWITRDNDVEVRYYKDPMSTFSQRFMSGFIGLFPLESQL